MEVWAKVGELDRANLKEGQEAVLQLDAIPDKAVQWQDQGHERHSDERRIQRRSVEEIRRDFLRGHAAVVGERGHEAGGHRSASAATAEANGQRRVSMRGSILSRLRRPKAPWRMMAADAAAGASAARAADRVVTVRPECGRQGGGDPHGGAGGAVVRRVADAVRQ